MGGGGDTPTDCGARPPSPKRGPLHRPSPPGEAESRASPAALSPATTAELARDALDRGRAALAAGDSEDAVRWLDRACRLAPDDHGLTLTLAAACLSRDPPRALALFARVTGTEDVREAWLGLSAANLRLGDAAGAAAALARALQRHAPEPGLIAAMPGMADQVVRAADAPGWCGLQGDGTVAVRTRIAGDVTVALDGRPCSGPKLPRGWEEARRLSVHLGRHPLLGSPIDIAAIRRISGFVQADNGGLRGWAWHPGDPDTDPTLLIRPVGGRRSLRITADEPADDVDAAGTLARPRRFALSADTLARMPPGPLEVLGPDGRPLSGSPLDPTAEQRATAAAAAALARLYPAALRPPQHRSPAARHEPPPAMPADVVGPPPPRPRPERRSAAPDVVIPVYGNAEAVGACLERVVASVTPPSRIVVVDDASPDPDVATVLERFVRTGRVTLLRQPRNGGFPAAANAGIAACPGRDVVLLNSDTWVPPGWLEQLHAAAWSAPDIGTATPLSNHATILSYPDDAERNATPTPGDVITLNRQAQAANGDAVVDIPVGVGFCLYIRRDCLESVGLLRADVFAQGYGEENDFCLRARHLGWRHVAVPGLFVGHAGGGSFGPAGRHLRARNEVLLNRLHPGYAALVQDFQARDPLAEARRRLDLQRWRALRRRGQRAAILVTHDEGGGVERQVAASAGLHRDAGRRAILLRPATLPDGTAAVQVSDGVRNDFPNLRFRLPEEMADLLRLLRAERPESVEVHHLLGHPPEIHQVIDRLRVPYSVHVHDYAWFCPRIALVGGDRRYCGEPALPRCESCIADHGALSGERITVADLRARSTRFLAQADQVVAPSDDTAARMRRHFPDLRPVVIPHEDDGALADPPPPSPRDGSCRVLVLGAIGLHKGYDVLLACARDAAERGLPMDFVVVGHTIDDARLLRTGRVFITGPYRPEEATSLIAMQRASLGFLPSIWPETWSLGLSELWRGTLPVAAFDLGAPAERIRRTGRGILLTPGLPSYAINNALVAACGLTVHEGT